MPAPEVEGAVQLIDAFIAEHRHQTIIPSDVAIDFALDARTLISGN